MSGRGVSRTIAVLLTLGALGTLSSPIASAAQAQPPRQHARVQQMYELLMCTLCHESLAVANSPQSYAERGLVREYIKEGLYPKQIENRMVAQYGEAVLAKPPHHGFGLLVYLGPPIVVVGGVALLLFLVPRWRRRDRGGPGAGGPGDGEPRLSAAESDRLDRELAERT